MDEQIVQPGMRTVTQGHSAPVPSRSAVATTMGKARILTEAAPYIKAFRGKTVVIKYGGSAMADETLRESFAGDVTLLWLVGIKPVIVHGGGPQITRALGQTGVEPQWVNGMRVTDAKTMRIVQTVLAGEINPDMVALLSRSGARSMGITGIDGGLFVASPKDPELGYVGELDHVDPGLVIGAIDQGVIPVIAPLAADEQGNVYNVNADTAAGALAQALGAEKIVYLTDVEGLYRDLGEADSLISKTTSAELRELLSAASAGMLPKLKSCIAALDAGVRQAHILDGRVQHALLLEVFTPEGIGTMVVAEVRE